MTFWSVCEILKTSVLQFWDSFQLVGSAVRGKTDAEDGLRTWGPVAQVLLPIAALAVVWGQKGFVSRFFLQFDKNCVSVFCPSFSKRERLLKWASGRLPPAWSSHANTLPGGPGEFWRDGSLLCTLINSAIPGACPNPHRHWRKPPSHGQALACKYLGLPPVFTEQDFQHHSITARQERVLFDYLVSIQQAMAKIALNDVKYSSRYAARGMGLAVGEQLRKTAFYIYSSSTTASSKHDVLVSIRGPYSSYCTVTIPAHYVTKKHIRSLQEKKKLAYQSRAQKSFFRSLSVDLGIFININQKAELNTIPVRLVSETDRVKVVFIPKSAGIHEVSIVTNGFHLVGSPFIVNVVENSSGVVDAFDEHPYKRSRRKTQTKKVISKVIDFVDEKITYDSIRAVPSYFKNIPRLKVGQEKAPSKGAEKAEEAYSFRQKAQDKIDEESENENSELELCADSNPVQEVNIAASPVGGDPTENEVTHPLASPEVSGGNQRTRTLQRQRRINLSSDEYDAFTAIPQKTKLCLSKSFSESSFNECEKRKPRSNSLSILNFLSSLKREDKYVESSHSESSLSDQEENTTVQQRLQFWERQSNVIISSSLHQQEKLPLHSEVTNISLKSSELLPSEKYQQEKLQFWEKQNSSNTAESSLAEKYQLPSINQTSNISPGHSESSLAEKYEQEKLTVQQRAQFWEKQNILSTSESSLAEKYQLPSINQTAYNNISPRRSESSLAEKYEQEKLMVQERMHFWESQSFRVSSKPRLKPRQSLPDLLPSSELLHKVRFRERQEYWKTIASRSSSDSSLASSIYYVEILGNLRNPKTRRSLPDVFSEEVLSDLAFRNFACCDFFSSDEGRAFRSTFKARRDFWEALSAKTLLYQPRSRTGSVEEDCYDSGFFNGANLSAESLESLRQYSDSLQFKLQYQEKKKFWECLSRQSSSICGSDSGVNHQNAKRPVKEDCIKLKELMSLKKAKKRTTEETTLHKENYHDLLQHVNLTDDIKQKQDTKRTKEQFENAKNYFLGLEKCHSVENSCK